MKAINSLKHRLLIGIALVMSGLPSAAGAETCAPTVISARGEPAPFEWLAKTKARANWRSRVRATRSLGPPYSTWVRAASREELCNTSAKGIVCQISAIPCRN
jgi:hypothetical protein